MFGNLIAVSYCGGSRGNAVAYAISFSPEVRPSWAMDARNAIDGNGAVWIKSRLYDTSRHAFHDIVSVHDHLGHDMYRRDAELPRDVVDHYADAAPWLTVDLDGGYLMDLLAGHRVVIADHADPMHNLALYPGSIAVAVHSDWRMSIRNFKSKYLDRPSEEDPGMTNLDMEILMSGMWVGSGSRKHRLRQHVHQLILSNMHAGNRSNMVIVDADRLFSEDTALDEYTRLISDLGMTSRWDLAGPWIRRYIETQWHR